MSENNKKNDLLTPSYSKENVVNRLSELKVKYQSLISELNGSSMENIDKIFGYSLNDDDIDSDLFINKINENLEIQDKIKILKENIAQKIKNIEKINSLNINKETYKDLKDKISQSFELFNDFSNENKNQSHIATQSAVDTEILLKKINDMQKSIDDRFSKLSSNLNVKDEAIYKDEIGFLKSQIDDLLIENREYKAKLSELISINNSKEDEITHSYNAWMKNSSKLNDLESLLMLQKEHIDSLDSEKNDVIETLTDKIKNIRNENSVYDQFYQDVNSSHIITNSNDLLSSEKSDELIKLIDSKLSDFKDEILGIANNSSNISNLNNSINEISNENNDSLGINFNEQSNKPDDKNLYFISEKLSEIIANKKTNILVDFVDNLEQILIRYKELSSMLDDEIQMVMNSVAQTEVEPAIDFDDIKSDLKNVDEFNNDNFKYSDSENIYEILKNLKTIDDFEQFLKDVSQTLNLLDTKATNSKLYIEKNIKENNRFLIDKTIWNRFHESLGKILIEIDTMLSIIREKLQLIIKSPKGLIIESNISQSNYWYCFIEAFDLLNVLLDTQKDKMIETDDDLNVMESIKTKIDQEITYSDGSTRNSETNINNHNSLINDTSFIDKEYLANPFDALKEVEKELKNEMHNVMINDTLSLEEKNKKLRLIISKLNRLEKMIDMYEVNEFEKFIDTL